jgi:hypothetical protein
MKETFLVYMLGCKAAMRRDKKTDRTYRFDGKVYYEIREGKAFPADVTVIRGHDDWVGVK